MRVKLKDVNRTVITKYFCYDFGNFSKDVGGTEKYTPGPLT